MGTPLQFTKGGKTMNKGIWILWALLTMPAAFAQGVYKWVDAEGQVHFGERPPGDVPASEVTLKTPTPATAAPPQDRRQTTQRLLRTFEEERAKKNELEAKAAQENEKRKLKCIAARDRLRSYEEAGYLYELDAKGERRILKDAERTAAHQRAQQDVKTYCSGRR
jgi:hypothetical protein